MPARLPSTVEAVVYYAAAEGLTKVAKYAQATAASFRLEATNERVVLRVGGDGAGGAAPIVGPGCAASPTGRGAWRKA